MRYTHSFLFIFMLFLLNGRIQIENFSIVFSWLLLFYISSFIQGIKVILGSSSVIIRYINKNSLKYVMMRAIPRWVNANDSKKHMYNIHVKYLTFKVGFFWNAWCDNIQICWIFDIHSSSCSGLIGISHSWAPAQLRFWPTRLRFQFPIVFVVVFIWRGSGTELSKDNFPQFHVLGPAKKWKI